MRMDLASGITDQSAKEIPRVGVLSVLLHAKEVSIVKIQVEVSLRMAGIKVWNWFYQLIG